MPKPIIIGYDPGLTSAIAAFDLRGNLLGARSDRNWNSSDMFSAMREFGQPIIVSTDRSKVSGSVEKLAARFGSKIWVPQENLGVEEKTKAVDELLKRMEIETNFNIHEEDAIAAAIFAYKNFAQQFSKIDDTLSQVSMEQHSDAVKRMLVLGEAKNINEAIEKAVGDKRGEKSKKSVSIPPKTSIPWLEDKDRTIKKLNESLDVQKLYIEKLERKLKEIERSKQQLVEDQLRKTDEGRRRHLVDKDFQLKENMVLQLRNEAGRLEKENAELRAKLGSKQESELILDSGEIPVIPIDNFSRESLAEADRIFDLKDKVLWIRNFTPSNATTKYCTILRPKAVVGNLDEETEEKLRNKGVLVVRDIEVKMHETIGAVDKDEFEKALKSSEKSNFLNWLSAARRDIEVH